MNEFTLTIAITNKYGLNRELQIPKSLQFNLKIDI